MIENNEIASVEALSWAMLPCVEGVSLSILFVDCGIDSNHISSLKALNKWNLKSMKSFSISILYHLIKRKQQNQPICHRASPYRHKRR